MSQVWIPYMIPECEILNFTPKEPRKMNLRFIDEENDNAEEEELLMTGLEPIYEPTEDINSGPKPTGKYIVFSFQYVFTLRSLLEEQSELSKQGGIHNEN